MSESAPVDELRRELNRLAISHSDLTLAVECARSLVQRNLLSGTAVSIDRGDGLITIGLTHALIISYCRPFTQRRDSGGTLETVDYLAEPRGSFAAQEERMHERLLDLRDQVVGHSDARRSEVSIRLDAEPPYLVHNWAERMPLQSRDLPVIVQMIIKLRRPLRDRMEGLTADLARSGVRHV